MKGYPLGFRWVLLVTVAVVWLTGILLAPTTAMVRWGWEVAWRLPADARVWDVGAHVLSAFAALMGVGALWSVHMRSGWRRHRQRGSGGLLTLLWVALAGSSVFILYAGSDAWSNGGATVHLVAGVVLAGLLTLHMLKRRRRERIHRA